MITEDQITNVRGATVYGSDGEKIGKVGDVYLDDQTGQPEWITINTGLFGTSESFVPMEDASFSGDDVQVPYSKSKIKDAPRVDVDGHLDLNDEEALFEYYGVHGGSAQTGVDTAGERTTTTTTTSGTTGTGYADEMPSGRSGMTDDARTTDARAETTRGAGYDTSGPTTDGAMTRSEEQLNVGTRSQERGRARLRKFVVTEQQTVTVPVSHEEVRLESEPITDANVDSAMGGPAISEEEHEVILHEEVPVVSKEAHAVERVRATTATVTEQQQVTEDVRKERIEMEGDTSARGTTTRGTDDAYETRDADRL